MRTLTSALVASLTCLASIVSAQQASQIICNAQNADNRNASLLSDYRFKRKKVIIDPSGTIIHSDLTEVQNIGGRAYFRLLEKDGRPLGSKEVNQEEVKVKTAVSEAAGLSDIEIGRRQEQTLRERTEKLEIVARGFDFSLLGDDIVNGRAAWCLQANPHVGYDGKYSSFLRHVRGKIWIDKKEYQWVKIEAEAVDTLWIDFLARIAKGSRGSFENIKVNDDVWAPKRQTYLNVSAQVAFVFRVNGREITFSDYRLAREHSHEVPTDRPCR